MLQPVRLQLVSHHIPTQTKSSLAVPQWLCHCTGRGLVTHLLFAPSHKQLTSSKAWWNRLLPNAAAALFWDVQTAVCLAGLFGPRVIFGISIPARLLLLTSGAVASAEPKEELQTGHLDGTLTTCLLNLWQSDSTPWAATRPGQRRGWRDLHTVFPATSHWTETGVALTPTTKYWSEVGLGLYHGLLSPLSWKDFSCC